jgi:hypothetical protein
VHVVFGAVHHDEADGCWVPVSQHQERDGILGDDGVARSGQLVLPLRHPQTARPGHVGHRPQLGREDRDLVAQALEVRGDRQQVGLHPTRTVESQSTEHDLHQWDAREDPPGRNLRADEAGPGTPKQ